MALIVSRDAELPRNLTASDNREALHVSVSRLAVGAFEGRFLHFTRVLLTRDSAGKYSDYVTRRRCN